MVTAGDPHELHQAVNEVLDKTVWPSPGDTHVKVPIDAYDSLVHWWRVFEAHFEAEKTRRRAKKLKSQAGRVA